MLSLCVPYTRSLETERERLLKDIDLLDSQLQDEQGELDVKSDRLSRLERDNRDLRVQLEHKIELGTTWRLFFFKAVVYVMHHSVNFNLHPFLSQISHFC